MKTKIKAIIEKGDDGLYGIRSDSHFGNSYFGGFGDSVCEAKEDFYESVKEAILEETEAGDSSLRLEDVSIEYHYDLPSFFNYFDYINVSRFAEYAGINESKMRAYKSGSAFPGEKTTTKIMNAVHSMGKELVSSTIR